MEVQGSGKEATRCCYNNHCNIDEQFLRQETLGCTSAIKKRLVFSPLIHNQTDCVCVHTAHANLSAFQGMREGG